MFAFAMGGAADLGPIKGERRGGDGAGPDWHAFSRAYGTIGYLNVATALGNVLIGTATGIYGLSNLLVAVDHSPPIWVAFVFLQLSTFVGLALGHYEYALVGMNFVALCNRWKALFALLSALGGVVTLLLGGDILMLTIVMQMIVILGIVRSYLVLRSVHQGRVTEFSSYRFDKQAWTWAWEPTWKGFLWNIGTTANVPISAIIFTEFGTEAEVAAFLFATNLATTIHRFAQAPFSSAQPLFSRLLASNQIAVLRRLIVRRIAISLGLSSLAIALVAISFPYLFLIIGSNVPFVPIPAWLLLGGLSIAVRVSILCNSVFAIGNDLRHYFSAVAALAISAIGLILLRDSYGVYTPIITCFVPIVLLLNVRPFLSAYRFLSNKPGLA